MSYALVTGGSKGIGFAIAEALAAEGMNLMLLARSQDSLDAAKKGLGSKYSKIDIIVRTADVTNFSELQSTLQELISQGKKISLLVNNAGGAESLPFKKMSFESWKQTFDLNIHSAFVCTKIISAKMLEDKSGRIINIASIAGLRGFQYVSAYCAAKHAMLGFSRALATEFKDSGVGVATVCPGYTETEMITGALKQIATKTGKSEAEIRKDFLSETSQTSFIKPEKVAETVLNLYHLPIGQMNGQERVIE